MDSNSITCYPVREKCERSIDLVRSTSSTEMNLERSAKSVAGSGLRERRVSLILDAFSGSHMNGSRRSISPDCSA